MDEIEFTWKWNKDFLDIRIFKDKKLYGHIPKFVDQKIAIINSKKYFLDSKLFQTNTFITDPIDNKAYCEIEGERIKNEIILLIKAPAFQYICSSDQKLLFGEKICRVKRDNKEVIRLIIPSGIFVDSGKMLLFTNDENVELLIYCLFYFNTLPDGDDVA
jgi:hypothetical protein